MALSKSELNNFNEALVDSIDGVISALLSQQVVEALHLNLKTKHSINPAEIPDNLQTLSAVLEQNFGVGARTISRLIAQKFYSKLGLEFVEKENYQLISYVEDARNKYTNMNNSI